MTNDESTSSNVSGGKTADSASRTCFWVDANRNVELRTYSYKYDQIEAVTGTDPVALFFKGDEYALHGKWTNLPAKICIALEKMWPGKLRELVAEGNVPYMGISASRMRREQYVPEAKIYYEKNAASREFVRMTRSLCKLFGVDLAQVKVTYEPRDGLLEGLGLEHETDGLKKVVDVFSSVAMAEVNVVAKRLSDRKRDADDLNERLKKLLATRFLNGVRPGSCIDQNKIRRAYREMFNADMPADFDFEKTLPKLGLVNEGKVFPLPNSEGAAWRKVIDGLIERGFGLFSYARIMELHAPEMIAAGVSSDEMLKKLLRESAADEFQIGKKYFACLDWPLKVPEAVVRVIPEGVLTVSERQLCRLLPCVDPADIHFLLASDGRFAWNSPDCFVLSERVEFDGQELKCALARVRKEVDSQGYFSLAQLEFAESASLNDSSLTTSACRKVFYNRYLMHDYAIHGQIVCHPGDEIDGRVPLREFCRAHSDVTLEQVGAVAKEYNIALDAAIGTVHEVMVRVDGDRFVSPEMVSFDVAVIDSELERYCVSAVTTLGVLDDLSDLSAIPGYNWNRFLLESFLRRASRRFMLMKPSASERDVAGVVVRRDSGIVEIAEALAMAAMASGVAADAHEVGEFLVATRCTQRRGANLIAQVVSRLRDLYERRKLDVRIRT